MNRRTDIDHSTLSWVRKELDDTLKQAAEALEGYTQQPDDETQLRFCVTHLHQVHGILQMLELFGAAMLTEEMEALGEGLLEGSVGNVDEAYEVLMRAILQLSDYLERIQGGHHDAPILILPLINDLRAARGANLVSENALFDPDLDAASAAPRHARGQDQDMAALAREVRHGYQLGLLKYLRGSDPDAGAERMLGALDRLDEASPDDQSGTLWWVAAGLVEALLASTVEDSVATRMLLGQVDREIKRLQHSGLTTFQVEPPRDLIRNLLFYVGRARPVGERIPAIQEQYDLKALLLEGEQLERAREGMFGPNSEVLNSVSDAIREDLAAIKDTLDLFARGSQKDPERLGEVAESLKRTADTLGVLGLVMPRQVVQEQVEVVDSLRTASGPPDENKIMGVAEALLYVESALQGLVEGRGDRRAGPSVEDVEAAAPPTEDDLFESEFHQVYGTAIDESLSEVGQIKDALVRYIEEGDDSRLSGLGQHFDNVRGVLRVLGLDRAGDLLDGSNRYLSDQVLSPGAAPDGEALDDLADAITSIEYYLEALREGRRNTDRILEVAETSLSRLGYGGAADPQPATPAPVSEGQPDGGADMDVPAAPAEADDEDALSLDYEYLDLETQPATAPEGGEVAAEQTSSASAVPDLSNASEPVPDVSGKRGRVNHDVEVMADEMDEEILEVFLEEAEEVLETLGETLPRWRENPEDGDALITSRRMFHTLKGSGRLAGALLLGELAWSMENLLNRVIDQTIAPEQRVFDILDESVAVTPELVRELKGGEPPGRDVRDIMRRAEALADPDAAVPAPAESTGAEGTGSEQPQGEEASSDDPKADEPPQRDVEAQSDAEGTDAFNAGPLEFDELPEQPDEADEDPYDFDFGAAEEIEVAAPAADDEADETDSETTAGADIDTEDPAVEDRQADDGEGGPASDYASELEAELAAFGDPAQSPEPADADEAEAIDLSDWDWGELEEADAAADEEAPEQHADAATEPLPVTDEADADAPAEEPVAAADESGEGAEAEPGTGPQPAMDPTLYEIFSKETADHLDVVDEFVADCQAKDEGRCMASESLVRALHTLTGSARMADVEPIARLGRRLEQLARDRQNAPAPLASQDIDTLHRGVACIRDLVAALGDAGREQPDVQPLIDEVDALPTPEPIPVETAEDEEPVPVQSDLGSEEDLVNLFLEEAEDILQFLDTSVQRWEDDPDHAATVQELQRSLHTLKGGARLAGFHGIGTLCHALESLTGEVAADKVPADDTFFDLLRDALEQISDMVDEAKADNRPEAPEALLQRIAELRGGDAAVSQAADEQPPADRELLEVFLEEATEILQSTEANLHEWRSEPDNRELIVDLQRALHTLKGGARMAGLQGIANVSHSLETLLIAVADGKVSPSDGLFDLLEQVHDRLYAMREQAANGQRPAEPTDLVKAIEAARAGDVAQPVAQDAADESAEVVPLPQREDSAQAEAAPKPASKPSDDGQRRQADVVRVRSDLLDNLVKYAGEVSIYRARLEQQLGSFGFNLGELGQTVTRLRDQLRSLEIETEAQILYRFERENEFETPETDYDEDFDPLELDRFSHIQELSRALGESVNDLSSIQGMLENLNRESETLLLQQSRVNTDLQDGLMRTRMVPFANLVPRMRRIVREASRELGKNAQLKVQGAEGEMDRTVLERVIPPLEHMLRNAVAHGIEGPQQRSAAGKPEAGTITVALSREGADVVIRVGDDGGGMNLDAIRTKAVKQGLMREDAPLTDKEVMQFVLEQGFSTAEEVTQIAGRGVGMDVVNAEIKQLSGNLEIDSTPGYGTQFTVRLPFTLALNQALLCQAGEEAYAIPLTSIEGVVRLSHEELSRLFENPEQAVYEYAGQRYEVRSLSALLDAGDPVLPGPGKRAPIMLVQAGDHRLALHVDGLLGSREIVVKSVGPQISSVPGIFGATILADGRVVLILDVSALVRFGATAAVEAETAEPEEPAAEDEQSGPPTVMVVDDSITMRKVATRLLERNNMNVVTAKDGVDAVSTLQESLPDVMLLDIEMPRMDGYELATHMRNDSRLKDVPIIMITSRTGEKHRQRALEIGVNRYLGKPYQEGELLETIRDLMEERRGG
ncbi:Hpt domain-containing protein [Ectothiorhodospiraceae bacterium WFHF3C12]|nr:Hpt domain-containing protein [Ectothiorhodospiraceae bacterium WFHF3C12]